MAAQPTRRRFTVAEYYRMGETGILNEDDRVELIKGEIIQMPPIGGPHASRVDRITRVLSGIPAGTAQVRVQGPVQLGPRNEPVPDLLLLHPRADYYSDSHPTAADVFLLIEVSDTSLAYDLRTKVPLYARHGITEVWIVDLTHDVVQVYREPAASGYQVVETRRRGDRIAVAAFPDIELMVEQILG
jgi:Uma2 family endonuclease